MLFLGRCFSPPCRAINTRCTHLWATAENVNNEIEDLRGRFFAGSTRMGTDIKRYGQEYYETAMGKVLEQHYAHQTADRPNLTEDQFKSRLSAEERRVWENRR